MARGPAREPAARKPGRAATVVSWLAVTVLGLSMGAIGLGGVVDLFRGDDEVGLTAAGTIGAPPSTTPSTVPSVTAGPAGGDLGSAAVVAPQQVPGGQALTGSAPSVHGVEKGSYAPFRPTALRLPSGAQAPVQREGVHRDGALNVPEDPDRVGWWTGGAQAGDPYGSMVLAGHVDSRVHGVGVMAEMLHMRIGQVVTVTGGGSGQRVQRYRVVAHLKITKAALAEGTDLFDQDVPHRLVMITCGGPFDRHTHRYRDNVVVVADPVP